MQEVEKQVESDRETPVNLEQKLLLLQEKLQNTKHKYQETIGVVSDLVHKLRHEQRQQKATARKLTELSEKLHTLEKECNKRYVQITELVRPLQREEGGTGDLVKEDKSQVMPIGPNPRMLEDRTMEEALHQAAAKGDTYTLLFLISHGANVNKIQEDKLTFANPTPLHTATTAGQKSTVFALLKAAADVNARGYTLATPLICAARIGNIGISQLLIKFGADVNFRDSRNMTALHYACSQGYKTLARLLIKSGANLSAKANDETPADTAESHGHKRLAKYIRSKMM